MTTVHKRPLRLAAVLLLLLALLTACVSKSAQAQEKIELGRKYLTELNYTEAVASFTEAIELDPDSIPAYMGRAEAYVGLEQYPEAKADYTTAIEKAAELPYTQAQAYVGRAEVNELTEELQDAESDYKAAQELLEAENIAEKEPVEDDVLTALKKKILYARAAVCTKLGLYNAAVTSYEKLTALGEDVTEQHTRVLDAALWAISTTQDLGAASQWMASHKVPEGDEIAAAVVASGSVENVRTWNISSWTKKEGSCNITQVYDGDFYDSNYNIIKTDVDPDGIAKNAEEQENAAIRGLVIKNQKNFQTLLANGFELRYYDHSANRMVAVYRGKITWPEETADLTETEAFFKAYDNEEPAKEDVSDFFAETVYVYAGGYSGKLREGEGCWGILNGTDEEWAKAFYQWENDAPVGGFLKKETAICRERFNEESYYAEERVSKITYSVGGTSFLITETFKKDKESGPNGINVFYGQLSAPLQELRTEKFQASYSLTDGWVLVLPAGTTVWAYECSYNDMPEQTVMETKNIKIESGKQYHVHFSRSYGSVLIDYRGK